MPTFPVILVPDDASEELENVGSYFSQVCSIAQGYIVGGAATVLVLPMLGALRRLGGRADSHPWPCGQPERLRRRRTPRHARFLF